MLGREVWLREKQPSSVMNKVLIKEQENAWTRQVYVHTYVCVCAYICVTQLCACLRARAYIRASTICTFNRFVVTHFEWERLRKDGNFCQTEGWMFTSHRDKNLIMISSVISTFHIDSINERQLSSELTDAESRRCSELDLWYNCYSMKTSPFFGSNFPLHRSHQRADSPSRRM